ncbi:hypothetical protein L1049_017231 [Liquidambar formosana]|uniref:Cystatin domain-containing protein n=1 Tax=Liquidambar formosana TaxID=63359 RepID=A0AAP0S763_LIQFO
MATAILTSSLNSHFINKSQLPIFIMAFLRLRTVLLTTATLLSVFFLAISVDYLTPVVGSGGGGGRMVGGRTEIRDVKTNQEVQDLGRFSVKEYNWSRRRQGYKGNGDVVFTEVVEAERQVVSGIKYYLKIAATQEGVPKVFESVVVVKPWVHSKELLNFAPSTKY